MHPWTGVVFIFLKNPAVLVLGTSLLSASFRFQGKDNSKYRLLFVKLSYLLSLITIICNVWGFFFRPIVFNKSMEFFVPIQSSESFFIQLSILSIAVTLSIQLLVTLIVLVIKYGKANGTTKSKYRNFIFAALSILFLAVLDVFFDLDLMHKEIYLFILTNVTIFAVTAVIMTGLSQDNIPTSVGFKIMTFNVTLIYLVLSVVANILFARYRSDFETNLEREKIIVKTQIEEGIKFPIIYQSEFVLETENKVFLINKPNLSIHNPFFQNERITIPNRFQIEVVTNTAKGVYWLSDFNANNKNYVIGISYLDYRKSIASIVLWLIFTLTISLFSVFLLYPVLHKNNIITPLNRLLEGIRKMQAGDLDVKVSVQTRDEIGEITKSFNQMIQRVKNSHLGLEDKIRQRTRELQDKLVELGNTQSQLLQAERLSTLGKIAASVAHEINNPLAAIKASASFLRNEESNEFPNQKDQNDDMNYKLATEILNEEKNQFNSDGGLRLKRKRELSKFFASIGFSEPASVADTCSDLGIESIPETHKILFQSEKGKQMFIDLLDKKQRNFHLSLIETAVDRASKIVFALKHYSYSGPKENKIQFSLTDGIDSVLLMYSSSWKQGIQIETDYRDNAQILGYPDELIQVWTNLLYNAVQACPSQKGKIKIFVGKIKDEITITIRDNGKGIPEEHLTQIFEPFFTTKELGMGTGLGLSTVKKIVDNHGGKIIVQSEPGNTSFSISLPFL
ncbi:HAMP domain-containing sensor histidine kinase [Leptospira kobayashii]|nr:HAMP domain-containing sensor histidine kinase [Leptospira kobayashii]